MLKFKQEERTRLEQLEREKGMPRGREREVGTRGKNAERMVGTERKNAKENWTWKNESLWKKKTCHFMRKKKKDNIN